METDTAERTDSDPAVDLQSLRAAVIDDLLEARAQVHAGELQQVWMALQWAHLHPAPVDPDGVVSDYAGWGDPHLLAPTPGREVTPLVPLAGPGAPLVSPLAPLALGAALGRSHDHARQLLGDALELAHRLPRLWALCQDGRVPVWLARRISRDTHDLSYDAALHADRLITAVPDRIAAVDTRRLVHEARLHADPDRAHADEEESMAKRGVWLRRDTTAPGVSDVHMTLDADDADLLDQTVARIAADLRDLGDTTSRDERRATAVGILADPQHALDLMSGRTTDTSPGAGSSGGGDVDLVVHLTETDLTAEHGVGVEETRGAVTTDQLATWIRRRTDAGSRVRVRAVLHDRHLVVGGPRDGGLETVAARLPRPGGCATSSTTRPASATSSTTRTASATSSTTRTTSATSPTTRDTARAAADWLARHGIPTTVTRLTPVDLTHDECVDHHDPPPLLREQVVLRDAHCVFPGCRRDSRTCDLDHIEPYVPPDDGGPPGQTRASNLAPLCRRHHNAKTHHHWRYRRLANGSYDWTSPTGHRYSVVPRSRAPLSHS